jgi:uncharacterized protein
MLHGFHHGQLEMRAGASGSRILRGRFPYKKPATLSDGGRTGRPRKEVIWPRAFSYRIDRLDEDIHLLIGHDYGKPLASRGAGTLKISDTDSAVIFEAIITTEMLEVSWVKDLLAAMAAGLVVGISPGFRIPPERAVQEAERIEDEDPSEGMAIIRYVLAALLYELSLVTRPAYSETQIDLRNWQPNSDGLFVPSDGRNRVLNRWRA